ncbi:SpoIIE family protein phosphatase [Streptomyces sp. NPDC007856]|uniref:SpoIIE family protein phosphatase n=1 Tax=Streptomyces sp. NPDC007856 TaxID=3364781 RepID=UPI0036AED1D0
MTYLLAEPGLPLGVDTEQPRPDHTRLLPPEATVVFYTDGLRRLLHRRADRASRPLHRRESERTGGSRLGSCRPPPAGVRPDTGRSPPSDGHDDMAILALRTPPA